MSNIEEDIKVLENLIVTLPNFYLGGSHSIANLLKDYTRQKQINEEHKKINAELREKVKELEEENGDWIKAYQEEKDKQFDILRNSIPKQKIKDIVDECIPKKENIITHEIEYSPNTNANSYLTEQILGLLQESEAEKIE